MRDLLYSYPAWLALFSVFVMALERLAPWRPQQRQLRPYLWSDLLHLVFNGHFLGVLVYGVYTGFVHAPLVALLERAGVASALYAGAASLWPTAVQVVVALVVVDFTQWLVHNLLHRVTALWQIHKVHHSIVDGEMDFIVSFRFHWLEVVVYKSVLYVPLAFFGFGMEAIFFHAVFGTLIGHLNHANVDIGWGPLRYVLNSPRMHIWHHDYEGDEKTTKNFGIILSVWDWIFGTAHLPDHPPARLGYAGVEAMPRDFLSHAAWPLSASPRGRTAMSSVLGVVVLGALFVASRGPHPFRADMPDGASSQPAKISLREALHPPEEATRALAQLGHAAGEAGWAHPEWMASASEVAAALGAPELVLIDVRPKARYEQGHLPTARNMDRADYSVSSPVPGLSRSAEELDLALEAEGVTDRSVIVLYGDGGAEPYRLWWTLREVLGVDARIMDGGVQAWKALELPTDNAPEPAVAAGRVLAARDPSPAARALGRGARAPGGSGVRRGRRGRARGHAHAGGVPRREAGREGQARRPHPGGQAPVVVGVPGVPGRAAAARARGAARAARAPGPRPPRHGHRVLPVGHPLGGPVLRPATAGLRRRPARQLRRLVGRVLPAGRAARDRRALTLGAAL
jgi:sterol desaturase/sphingolipid hydroxylase (fatty acid hydroxylase superfamily)/rhodanese-related sulfurtransferase